MDMVVFENKDNLNIVYCPRFRKRSRCDETQMGYLSSLEKHLEIDVSLRYRNHPPFSGAQVERDGSAGRAALALPPSGRYRGEMGEGYGRINCSMNDVDSWWVMTHVLIFLD